MIFNRLFSGLALALLTSVSGCGGGGASGSGPIGGGAAPVPPPVVSTSGLVPEAGTAGATLYADAAPLRVLRDGAVWTYRGVDQPRGAASGEIGTYTNTVKHAAASGGMWENNSNVLNRGQITFGPVRFEGGAYKYTQRISLVEHLRLTVDKIELRSPVRINDQYVSLDQHIADGGADYDGDNINEAFDVALYSRVIGEELLDLPNLRQVKTVRVDTTFRARAISSTTGAAFPLYEAVESRWYARGLGVVQMRVSEPVAPSLPNRVFTETLQNWDGLTEGLGNTVVVAGVAPASSPLAGAALQYPLDAVGFDTHAVVVTDIPYLPGQPKPAGVVLAYLDMRGNVLAARSYTPAELFPAAQYFTEPRLLRVGNELRMVARTNYDGVSMVAFDSTGQRLLRPAVTLLSDSQLDRDYEFTSYRVSANGSGIWLGWLRNIPINYTGKLKSVVVQHFDADGLALNTAHVFAPVSPDISDFNMALGSSRLAISWLQTGVPSQRRLEVIDTNSDVLLADKTLGSAYDACTHVDTLALEGGIAMTCWSNMGLIGAAKLASNGDLELTAGATLATDTLKAPWLTSLAGSAMNKEGYRGQLIVSASQFAKYWPEDPVESPYTAVFRTDASNGPLAATEPVLLARIPGPPFNLLTTVQLANSVLLIGSDGGSYLNSMAVWQVK